MAPQHFIFGVRCPRLACHTYDGERDRSIEKYFKYRQEKGNTVTLRRKLWDIKIGQTARQGTEMKSGELL